MIADHMAKIGLTWKSNLQLFDEPPLEMVGYLQQGKNGGVLVL